MCKPSSVRRILRSGDLQTEYPHAPGIGWRNQLIKAPMMRLVASEPNATYMTINLGEIYIADNIKEKSFGLDGRLDELLPALREACEA